MEPRIKLWLEHEGRIVMSDYRLRLLGLVEETGSLADAAARLGLSYRRAWGKIKELERNLAVALVQSAAGGAGGGHTQITAEGRDLLRRYASFHARVEDAAQAAYAELFAGGGVHPTAAAPTARAADPAVAALGGGSGER